MKRQFTIKGRSILSRTSFFISFLFICCGVFLLPGKVTAQQNENDFDEVIVTIQGQNIGTAEIQALVIAQDLYLPVSDLFNYLAIKNKLSGDSIIGHILNPNDVFIIDKSNHTIYYNKISTSFQKNDLIFSSNEYYLKINYFGKVFGLQCNFNFRSLTVDFISNIELPFMREKRLDQMRRNITKVKGDIVADTVIIRKFKLLHLGALDWNIASTQYQGNNTTWAKIAVGGILAGGETNAQFLFSNHNTLDIRNQIFQWHYVNNEQKYVKQISLGTIYAPGSYSTIPSLLGVQMSNTATRQRKSFGSWIISNSTEPGWIVELYINDVLVDYTKADASGLFSFEIPLVYGNSKIRYKFYGPWGEERSAEQLINIPFSFLPKNTVEYSLTTGKILDSTKNLYGRLNIGYGLTKQITIGTGVEYNSSLLMKKALTFLNVSARIGNSLILSGEYSPGTFIKFSGNYRLQKKLQVEALIIKYAPGQEAIRTSSQTDQKLMFSMPFKIKNYNGFTRLVLNKSKFYKEELKTAELLTSITARRVNANITSYAVFYNKPEIMSKLAINIPIFFNARFTPQVQYHFQKHAIVMLKGEFEKRAFNNMVVNMGYEYNKLINTSAFTLGVRYNFSFAQVGIYNRKVGKHISSTQSASGAVLFEEGFKNIRTTDKSNVGQGTILLLPFLDYNCNYIHDANEPEVLNLNVRVDGCKIDRNSKKAAVKVSALEAYQKYYIKVDDLNFDNPAYQIKNKVIEVEAEPNFTKKIEIPVSVLGEVNGYVNKRTNGELKGVSRVILQIYNEAGNLVAKTLSEQDGYFSFLGLIPGNYFVTTDAVQMEKVGMANQSGMVHFTIKENKEGDIIDNVVVVLVMDKANTGHK